MTVPLFLVTTGKDLIGARGEKVEGTTPKEETGAVCCAKRQATKRLREAKDIIVKQKLQIATY